MDFTRCTGCDISDDHDLTNWDWRRVNNSDHITRQQIKDLEMLIQEVDNYEDRASLEAEVDERRQWLEILELIRECKEHTYSFEPSRYGRKIDRLSRVVPGANDLYNFTRLNEHELPKPVRRHLLRIFEVSDLSWSKSLAHRFDLDNPTQIAQHLEVITSVSSSSWPLIFADRVSPIHVICLGQLLNLNPRLFISHMWRSFYQHPLEFGLPMMETPSARIVVDELHDDNTGESHPLFRSRSLHQTHWQDSAAPHEGPSTKVVHHAAVEGIRQRHWTAAGRLSRFFREEFEASIRHLTGQRIRGPVYWVDKERSNSYWGGKWQTSRDLYAHASLDFMTCTSFYVLESSPHWRSLYGLVLQSPWVDSGSTFREHYPTQQDRRSRRNTVTKLWRQPDTGQPYSVSAVIESVLFHHRRNQALYRHESMKCKQLLSMQEISVTVMEVVSVRDLICADLRTLHAEPLPHSDSAQVFASRARAKRQLIVLLKERLSGHLPQTLDQLPREPRILCQRAITESLEIAHAQSLVLDELDHTIIELRENQFRQLQIELAETQIAESRKAMEQTDTVARLTILAFIYIPASCVCGVFGMNFVETPQGFPLWIFGVTLAAVLVTTLWIAFAGRFYLVTIQAQYYLFKYLVYRKMPKYWPVWVWEFSMFLVDVPRLCTKGYRKIRARLRQALEDGRHLRPEAGYPGDFDLWVSTAYDNITQRIVDWRAHKP